MSILSTAVLGAFPTLPLAVSMKAESLAGKGSHLTNSLLFAALVAGGIIWFVRGALAKKETVPSGRQNFLELIVEFLYGQVESLVGKKVAPSAFPLLATLFIFILVSNWTGLLPGVADIGWGEGRSWSLHEVHRPILRPLTADLNGTLAMTLVVFAAWIFFTVRETGVWGFLVHTFGPKGGLKGFMGLVMIVIFFAVGLIELFSILLRNVTLPMRLYGNIYAGENVLHTMMGMLAGKGPVVSFLGSVLIPLPFYFMELLVGILQAMVFTLLTAVYIKLSTTHDDHGEEHHH